MALALIFFDSSLIMAPPSQVVNDGKAVTSVFSPTFMLMVRSALSPSPRKCMGHDLRPTPDRLQSRTEIVTAKRRGK